MATFLDRNRAKTSKFNVLHFHFRRSKQVFFEAVKRLPWAELSSTRTLTRFNLKLNHTCPKVIHMKTSNGSSSHICIWLREGNWKLLFQLSSDLCNAAVLIS